MKKQGISHRLLITLKNNQCIFCNETSVFTNYIIKSSDIISIDLNYKEESDNIVSVFIPLSIIYEDEAVLIINKPAGIPVHPSLHYYENSISNGVKYYFNQIGLNKKIRPVNRLDKDTSGLVMFAKNEYVQECLIRQMQTKQFKKEYIALVEGTIEKKHGTINAPIARKGNSIIERCVSPNGETAITHYAVLKEYGAYSLVQFLLETGRTHQIRVHCQYMGHPILGDTLYGKTSNLVQRQALHAYKVEFLHPITKRAVCYTAPITEDLKTKLHYSSLL